MMFPAIVTMRFRTAVYLYLLGMASGVAVVGAVLWHH
jgi:hypothetical protein